MFISFAVRAGVEPTNGDSISNISACKLGGLPQYHLSISLSVPSGLEGVFAKVITETT
jgi:hypothetical protein